MSAAGLTVPRSTGFHGDDNHSGEAGFRCEPIRIVSGSEQQLGRAFTSDPAACNEVRRQILDDRY